MSSSEQVCGRSSGSFSQKADNCGRSFAKLVYPITGEVKNEDRGEVKRALAFGCKYVHGEINEQKNKRTTFISNSTMG